MNERILELANSARKYAETKPDIYQVAYEKKFAELIVRECAEVCHKMAEDSDNYVVHDGDTCAAQIKHHFAG